MKKNKITRLLALTLSFSMVLSMAACGQKESGKTDNDKDNQVVDEKQDSEVDEGKSQTTFTVWASSSAHDSYTEDIANNEFTLYLEEETGVHLDWTFLYGASSEDATTKFNLMLTSGDELPDIFLENPFDRNTLYEAGCDGIVIPLNDLIEEHTVNMKKYFEEHPGEYESLIAPDGNIYGLGYFTSYHHGRASNRMWIYQPWLDALGLEMPTTTEEFYDTLIAFRDKDPNGNGEKDEIPLVNMNSQGLRFLMNSFCYYDGSNLEVNDGIVKFVSNTEEYREGLRYLAKLYSEGLMPQDVFSMEDQQISALVNNEEMVVGAAGMFALSSYFTDMEAEDSSARDMEAVLPLKGPNGVQQTVYSPMYPNVNRFAITSACEDPVAAIQWVDWFFDQDNSFHSMFGEQLETNPTVEGNPDYGKGGWWKNAEGDVDCLGNPAGYGYTGATLDEYKKSNYSWAMQVAPWIMPEEVHTNLVASKSDWQNGKLYRVADEYLPYAVDKSYSNLVLFNSDEGMEAIADYKTQINSLASQWRAEFITGVKDLDADWDTYLKELEALDLEGYLEVLQSEYEYANSNK